MTKVVKRVGFVVGLLTVLLALPFGEQAYLDRQFYKKAQETLLAAHDLSVKLSLESSISPDKNSGFKNMMKSQAVFLTKTRELNEVREELGRSLKKSDLTLQELTLDPNSTIPDFSQDGQTQDSKELSASETYEPLADETFMTQNWIARVYSKKDTPNRLRSWLDNHKNKGSVAIIVDNMVSEGDSVLVYFRSGMIPTMKMPKRVLNLDHLVFPTLAQGHFFFTAPDLFHFRAKAFALEGKFNRLKSKILVDSPKILNSLQSADKAKWLWMASMKSKEFIEAAKRK